MTKETELFMLLSQEASATGDTSCAILERLKIEVSHLADTDSSVAVLSDIVSGKSYVFNGGFGKCIGLREGMAEIDSIFEQDIFSCIPDNELTNRHVLELRYTLFQRQQPVSDRRCFNTVQLLHFRTVSNDIIPVLHRTYVAASSPSGSIWLTLCLYTPFIECSMANAVVDNRTGKVIPRNVMTPLEDALLSEREKEILHLLAKGYGSKQIADELSISVHTVNRHRQNIISSMQVSNTTQAVSSALSMGLI